MKKDWSLLDKLALTYFKGVNAFQIKILVEKYNSFFELFDNIRNEPIISKTLQISLFNNEKPQIYLDSANKEIEACAKHKIRLIDFWSDEYPAILKDINSAPAFLYVKGSIDLTASNNISIVGTRRITQYGKLVCEKFTENFSRNGFNYR